MELGAFQIPAVVALTLILAGSLTVLIHDYRKERNERIRALTREVHRGREEEQKLLRRLASQHAQSRLQESLPPPAPDATPELPRALSRAKAPDGPAAAPANRVTAKRDWNSLLAVRRGKASPSPVAFRIAPHVLPVGFQNAAVLRQLIESRQPVSGLVVSIGVDSPLATDESAVRSALESLLEPGELAAPTAPGEFALLLPAERGASAQRRLGAIAQQLWDLQLGSLSEHGIQFTWGGVEVHNQALDEALAGASERMWETRRGRQTFAAHA